MRVEHRARPRVHPAADLAAPPDWTVMERILLVRPDNLGDVVMLTPALRALRAAARRRRPSVEDAAASARTTPARSDASSARRTSCKISSGSFGSAPPLHPRSPMRLDGL